MLRKVLSVACCLAPIGAMAETITLPTTAGNAYVADGITVAGDTYFAPSGNGLVLGTGGLNVADAMFVGANVSPSASGGQFYIGTDTSSLYTIRTDGAVSVGALLQVVEGRSLAINSKTNGTLFNVTLGQIDNDGKLNIGFTDLNNDGVADNSNAEVNALVVNGAIESAGNLGIAAATMEAGAIESTAGYLTLDVESTLEMAQLNNAGSGHTDVTAGSIVATGDIQNGVDGTMDITVTGDTFSVAGSMENSGSSMNIIAPNADITVTGTMKNDSTDGTMVIKANNLTVSGGGGVNAEPSFANAGNLDITVAGTTQLANGFDLSVMKEEANFANTFSLDTGELIFGAGTNQDQWLQVFSNNQNKFNLAIRQGDLNLGVNDIVNGTSNTGANMSLLAMNVVAGNVNNIAGNLTVTANTGNITVSSVTSSATNPTNTQILANQTLTVTGNASNNGTMVLSGEDIIIGSTDTSGNLVSGTGNITNNGESMEIASNPDVNGSVSIMGNVTNKTGELSIESREILVGGVLTNNGGNLSVDGSDVSGGSVILGGINAQGGTFDLNSKVGTVYLMEHDELTGTGGLAVTGGALNIGQDTRGVFADNSVQINGDVTASATETSGAGNVNIAGYGNQVFQLVAGDSIVIDGNISAIDNVNSRSIEFSATTVDVGGDVTATNKGNIIFQDINGVTWDGAPGGVAPVDMSSSTNPTKLTIAGDVSASDGGKVEFYSDDIDVGSLNAGTNGLVTVHGDQITANNENGISVANGVWFDGTNTATSGMLVKDTDVLTLKSTDADADIDVAGGISLATTNTLVLDSANDVIISGQVAGKGLLDITAGGDVTFNNNADIQGVLLVGKVGTGGELTAGATDITMGDVSVSDVATATLIASNNVTTGAISNAGDMTLSGAGAIKTGSIETTAGVTDITGASLTSTGLLNASAGQTNLDISGVTSFAGAVSVAGDLNQGTAKNGMLNLVANNSTFDAESLSVGGNLVADANSVMYRMTGTANITGNMTVSSSAGVMLNASSIAVADVTNNGTLALLAQNGMNLGTVANAGALNIHSGTGIAELDGLQMNNGNVTLAGAGMTLKNGSDYTPFTTTGMLYQQYAGALANGDVNIESDDYTLTTSNMTVQGINQTDGTLNIVSSDLTVNGNVSVEDMVVSANPSVDWLDVSVGGNVSGGVDFIGLEQMTITGNYIMNDNSKLNAVILPYASTPSLDTSIRNYWSSISLNDDNTLGEITNATDGEALIQVGGKLTTEFTSLNTSTSGALQDSQFGINLFQTVDQGTAIWLLHAEQGIQELATQIRNLNVMFCNASGTICYNYLDSLDPMNESTDDSDLPAYVSVRDTDGDGQSDSLYVVFDPRFGGPVTLDNFKIQPIVGREPDHTQGEYVAAGALDDLLIGQLHNKDFGDKTPIEVIPLIFDGTNMEQLADELYARMEYYQETRDGQGLARFSRLVQAREIEQVAGAVALNDHTSFRDFEDRMFDEFIWNRNRNLDKGWIDFDYGMIRQDVDDNKVAKGNRFSIAGGYDWTSSNTLILGVTGRISHMSTDNSDEMELGYKVGQSIKGRVDVDVADTNVGLGGYLMKTLGAKTRLYGNAFLDMHFFDIDRQQTYMSSIDGDGNAFALTSEWGLLHDLLNQYVVGNIYARVGYNFGFDITEQAQGADYMKLKSDGYMTLTPGYSLVAQKRIYPTSWFQIRPYASIGVEYDVMGAPTYAEFKFAQAEKYTRYDIDINPMWANIGGGIEFISANGIQFGMDYRYQYNTDIRLHNIKVTGSYRF